MKKLIPMLLILALIFSAAQAASPAPDYADSYYWAYYESGASDKAADVFFIAPTVFGGEGDRYNMPLDSENYRGKFIGATNMEKGIYDGDARFFAPYYRQIGLAVYLMEEDARQQYLDIAFGDVKDAFEYYMAHDNGGRPIVVAGFSQGAEMAIRLVKECFAAPERQELLVACYAIGWRLTEEETRACSHLRPAQSEDDLGTVIAFNSEAEEITGSMMIPEGVKTYAINPLNWKTDATPADRSLNLGACFTNYSGQITKEIPALTGAYIDEVRGALKVTDITPAQYPAGLASFAEGVYHIYDYQFFYRNLQQNVRTRIETYLMQAALDEAA